MTKGQDKNFEPIPTLRGISDSDSARQTQWQSCLLCIDLQHLGCVEGFGVFENHRASGVSEDAIQYYLKQVREVVLPNGPNCNVISVISKWRSYTPESSPPLRMDGIVAGNTKGLACTLHLAARPPTFCRKSPR